MESWSFFVQTLRTYNGKSEQSSFVKHKTKLTVKSQVACKGIFSVIAYKNEAAQSRGFNELMLLSRHNFGSHSIDDFDEQKSFSEPLP